MMYRVNIREVWISTREVEMPEGATNHEVIQAALDEDDETEFEYSHTLDSENHIVEEVEEKIPEPPCPNNCEAIANGKHYDCPVCPRIWHPKFEGEES